jgi:hypothetical protein
MKLALAALALLVAVSAALGNAFFPAGQLTPPPSVWIDFTRNFGRGAACTGSAASCITVNRPSVRYCDTISGTWISAAANQPCMTDKGLFTEEARTNWIRNNVGVGAVPGTPGTVPTNWSITGGGAGLSTQVVGTGVENGIDYVDLRWFGTAVASSASFSTENTKGVIAVSTGQVWTSSVFLKLVAGSFTNTLNWNLIVASWDSGGVYQGNLAGSPLLGVPSSSGIMQRYSANITITPPTAVSVTQQIFFNTAAGPVDFTVRVGWSQLELGAFVTSPIRTTGAALARNTDVVTLNSPPSLAGPLSVYQDMTPTWVTNSASVYYPVSLDSGATANSLQVRQSSLIGGADLFQVSGGLVNVDTGSFSMPLGSNNKIAFTTAADDVAYVINGAGAALQTDNLAPLPVGMNRIGWGIWTAAPQYVRQFGLWSGTRLTNDQLVNITTPSKLPDVWLDFAGDNAIGCPVTGPVAANCLTVARAGSRWCDTKAGTWISAAANLPCITDKGLLVEEARTNGIRNNAMIGAVPGTPGTLPTFGWNVTVPNGLTTNVIGTGVESGIDYIDLQIVGTAASTQWGMVFEAAGIIAAAQNQVWSDSMFWKLAGGSLTNITNLQIGITQADAGNVFLANTEATQTSPTSAGLSAQRVIASLTADQVGVASLRPNLLINMTAGQAINLTLRIGWPQAELNSIGHASAFATSPIRTAGAAVTRAADLITMTQPPPIFGSAFSVYAAGTPMANVEYNVQQTPVTLSNGTPDHRVEIDRQSPLGVERILYEVNVAVGGANGVTAMPTGVPLKMAAGMRAGDQAGVANGGTPVTLAFGGTPTINTVTIGGGPNGQTYWNGYLTAVGVWGSQRLSNADLTALTRSLSTGTLVEAEEPREPRLRLRQ